MLLLCDCKLRLLSINHATIIYGVPVWVCQCECLDLSSCAGSCICDHSAIHAPLLFALSRCVYAWNYFSVFDFSLWNTISYIAVCFVVVAPRRSPPRSQPRLPRFPRGVVYYFFALLFLFYGFFPLASHLRNPPHCMLFSIWHWPSVGCPSPANTPPEAPIAAFHCV